MLFLTDSSWLSHDCTSKKGNKTKKVPVKTQRDQMKIVQSKVNEYLINFTKYRKNTLVDNPLDLNDNAELMRDISDQSDNVVEKAMYVYNSFFLLKQSGKLCLIINHANFLDQHERLLEDLLNLIPSMRAVIMKNK